MIIPEETLARMFELPYRNPEQVEQAWKYVEEVAKQGGCTAVAAFIQSSGYGKSRLFKEVAQQHYIVSMVFPRKVDPEGQWPRPTPWSRRFLARVTESTLLPEEVKNGKTKVDLNVLVERAEQFIAGMTQTMISYMMKPDATPAGWYEYQMKTEEEFIIEDDMYTALMEWGMAGDKHNFPKQPIVLAIDDAEFLSTPIPCDPEITYLDVVRWAFLDCHTVLMLASRQLSLWKPKPKGRPACLPPRQRPFVIPNDKPFSSSNQ